MFVLSFICGLDRTLIVASVFLGASLVILYWYHGISEWGVFFVFVADLLNCCRDCLDSKWVAIGEYWNAHVKNTFIGFEHFIWFNVIPSCQHSRLTNHSLLPLIPTTRCNNHYDQTEMRPNSFPTSKIHCGTMVLLRFHQGKQGPTKGDSASTNARRSLHLLPPPPPVIRQSS